MVNILKKRKTLVAVLFCTLVVFSFLFWYSYSSKTIEYATINKITSNSVSLENDGGRKINVNTSLDVSELVEVGQKYWVTYEKRKWQAPILLSIGH